MKLSEITLATTNKGKLAEFENAFAEMEIALQLIKGEFNCPETGQTFLENAVQKAQLAAKLTSSFCLADDSGLAVEALNGDPGIYSARFFDNGNGMNKIITRLQNSNNRKAYFVCALVLVNPWGEVIWQTEEKWFGQIAHEICGNKGFGYDPIFIPTGYQITVGEMEPALKEKISHRGQAIEKLKQFLKELKI